MPDGPQSIPFEYKADDSLDLLDSEIIVVEGVLKELNKRSGVGGINIDAFDREIVSRFFDAGFNVTVNWYSTNVEGVYIPEVQINSRTRSDDGMFDHERMAHEVQTDLLDLGTGGIVKPTAEDIKRFASGAG